MGSEASREPIWNENSVDCVTSVKVTHPSADGLLFDIDPAKPEKYN
ncbi:MAG: hypothetical protein KKH32_07855 [Bacteroidetes bacterium]|nr:hypothetical protein [Bacteroidota bacterium]